MGWDSFTRTRHRLCAHRHGRAIDRHRRLLLLHRLAQGPSPSETAAVAALVRQTGSGVVMLSDDSARDLARLLKRLVDLRRHLLKDLPPVPESPVDRAQRLRTPAPKKRPKRRQ